MDVRFAIILLFCSLAVVIGQKGFDPALYTGRLLPSSYGLGLRGYMMPVYNGEKPWIAGDSANTNHVQLSGNDFLSRYERSMTERMKSLKSRYNGQFRNIFFGKWWVATICDRLSRQPFCCSGCVKNVNSSEWTLYCTTTVLTSFIINLCQISEISYRLVIIMNWTRANLLL